LQIEGGQTNLTEFFEGAVGSGTFAPRRKVVHKSKRLTKAMANLKRAAEDDDVQEIAPRKMPTKRRRPAEVIKVESDEDEGETGDTSGSESSSSSEEQVKRGKGRGSGGTRKPAKRKMRK
jgi:hypothetical protein